MSQDMERMMSEQIYVTVDEYIALFDGEIREILINTRQAIRENAPDATERISYRMPCYWQGQPLIYFAAMKHHLGIYPTASGMEFFSGKLTDYKTSKGAIQFPYGKPIDYELITDVTRWRVAAVEGKADG